MRRILVGAVLVAALTSYSVAGQVRGRGGRTSVSVSGATLLAGTLSATVTAAPLGSTAEITKVLIQNDPDNAVDILCGNSTVQPIQIEPGNGLSLDVTDVALVHCKTVSSTATVGWIAR